MVWIVTFYTSLQVLIFLIMSSFLFHLSLALELPYSLFLPKNGPWASVGRICFPDQLPAKQYSYRGCKKSIMLLFPASVVIQLVFHIKKDLNQLLLNINRQTKNSESMPDWTLHLIFCLFYSYSACYALSKRCDQPSGCKNVSNCRQENTPECHDAKLCGRYPSTP